VHTVGHPDRQAGKQVSIEQAGMEIRRHGMKRWHKGRIGSINTITMGGNALIYLCRMSKYSIVGISVADPGCVSRMPDHTFSIPNSGFKKIGSRIRISITGFKYPYF
jgi:hypothetical protein